MFGMIVDGAARVKPSGTRDWAHKKSTKAPIGPLARDNTRRRHEPMPKYSPELIQAARALGMSADKLKGMLALQRKFGK